jgi:hypothetical protein
LIQQHGSAYLTVDSRKSGVPQDRDSSSSEVPGRTVTPRRPTRLLQESQRNEIIAAIEKAGLDPSAFNLTDEGVEVRVEHTMSASCLTFYRDKTWRYLGTHFVGYGAEKPFDSARRYSVAVEVRAMLSVSSPSWWTRARSGVGRG